MTARWEAYAPWLAVDWVQAEPDRRHRQVEGGLLFLDVSGFTAMSERLAALGRVGAEEVTEVVGETFTRLLEPAYDDGGSMLKFGGDALLLLFAGDDGGVRAARAGHAMLQVLHAANPVTSRAGPITLGATVGVHAGTVDLALIGTTSRELLVLGPTLSETLRVEASADRDTVLVSRTLAATLPDEVLGPAVGAGVLLRAAPHGPRLLGTSSPKPAVPAARQLVPAAVADALESGATEGEHRMASVAFLHVDGTDGVREAEGPEALAARVEEVVGVVQDTCQRYDLCLLGTDVDIDGAKLIVTAGVPRSHEDDTDRLLGCLRDVLDLPRPLTLRVGVARGPVFAGPVGPPYRRTFTLLGDTVNLAARVMARAGEDELLATVDVPNAARTLFEAEAREPFSAKGKSLPVQTVALGREIGIRLRMRPDEHVLVGREAELARLSALVATLDAAGAVACLCGPPGIGKSRLVDELQHHNPEVPFVLAACVESQATRPFQAAVQILRALVGGERTASPDRVLAAAETVLPRLGPTYAGLLPLLAPVLQVDLEDTPRTSTLDAAFRLAATQDLITALLRAVHPDPMVLVVEDAQWLDTESASMLGALVSTALAELPWLVVVTARDRGDLPRLDTTAPVARVDLELGALGAEEARNLVLQDVEQGRLGMDRVDDLVARAGGNPLLLTELVAAVAAGAEGSDELEKVFRQRLDLLAGADRRLLGQAAVLGVEFPPALLAAVAGPDAVSSTQLERLRDFLRPMRSGPLRFNQTLYQEVAYATIPFRRREELHARAARAIDAMGTEVADRDEVLSRHWFLAGEHDRAWLHTLAAAEQATRRHAPSTAAALYRRAIEAGMRDGRGEDDLATVHERLGEVLEVSGAYEDAARAYEEALPGLDGSARARVQVRLASAWEKLGAYDRSLQLLATVEDPEPEVEARRQVELAIIHNRTGRFEDARDAAGRVDGSVAPEVHGRALMVLAWALDGVGDDRAREVATRATTVLEEAGDLGGAAKALITEGAACYVSGEWDASVRAHERASSYQQQVGDRVSAAISDLNIGEIRVDQGRLQDARRQLVAAERVLSAAHHRTAVAFATLQLGRVAALEGNAEEARQRLAAALASFLELDATDLAPQARARQAEAELFAGRYEAALDRCETILDDLRDEHLAPLVRRVAACASWRLGRRAAARRLIDGAAEAADALGDRYQRLLTSGAVHRFWGGPPPPPEDVRRFGISDLDLVALGPHVSSTASSTADSGGSRPIDARPTRDPRARPASS